MSTQIKFDLAGLSRALESGDSRYLLALYADNAEVQIIEGDDPASPRILQGKLAIASWIDDLCAKDIRHRVLNSRASETLVALIEERETPDGANVRYAWTAEVSRGQITRDTVTASVGPAVSGQGSPGQGSPGQADPLRPADLAELLDLPAGSPEVTSREEAHYGHRVGDFYLAGNFLG
jgi:ketosteroid isomerase-like protein